MANIRINDVPQRIQYVATAPTQSVFAVPFPFLANTDIVVWQDTVELTQGAGAGQYGLTGAGTASGGTMTLVTAVAAGTIITITGEMPIDRTSIYSPTISNLTGDDLNNDFNRLTIMVQELYTVQNYMQLEYKPFLEVSQDIDVTVDRWLPILPATHVWRKNDGDTAIETAALPAFPVGSVGGNFNADNRIVKTNIAGGLNNLEQTTMELTDVNVMQSTAGSWGLDSAAELDINATTNLNLQGQRWPATIGAQNQVIGVDGGILAYVDAVIAPNPTTSNVIPKFINTTGGVADSLFSESGTDLLLAADPTVALAAATKQYVDNAAGGLVDSVTGTANQIDVDNVDPANPVLSLSATTVFPGTVTLNADPITNLEAATKQYVDGLTEYAVLQSGYPIYALSTGASSNYVVTLAPIPAAYTTGMVINFKADFTNTVAATLDVNGLGVKNIVRADNTPTEANDITNGRIITVVYDGVSFQVISGSGGTGIDDYTKSFLLGGM